MRIQSLVLCLGLFVVINGCSGGGTNLPNGNQCRPDYKPIPMPPLNGEKIVSMDLAAKEMKPGYYEYNRTDLYFVANVKDEPFSTQVQDYVATPDGKTKPRTICVRNAKAVMPNYHVEATGINTMCIDKTYSKAFVTERLFGFDMQNGKMVHMKPKDNKSPGAPKDVYKGLDPNFPEPIMILHPPNDYEVRTKYKNGSGDEYYLSVHLTYKDGVPCESSPPTTAVPAAPAPPVTAPEPEVPAPEAPAPTPAP